MKVIHNIIRTIIITFESQEHDTPAVNPDIPVTNEFISIR
jgi:hypothetical protein